MVCTYWAPYIFSDSMIGWVFSRENAGTRRTADLTGCIAPSKFHALLGNSVNIWGLIKGGALIAKISGTQIIYKNK